MVGPFERQFEKEPQRRDGGVDGRRADLLLRHMQLKAAKVLARRRSHVSRHGPQAHLPPLGFLRPSALANATASGRVSTRLLRPSALTVCQRFRFRAAANFATVVAISPSLVDAQGVKRRTLTQCCLDRLKSTIAPSIMVGQTRSGRKGPWAPL